MNFLQKRPSSPTGGKYIWRPRTGEEIARKRNRKVINQYLKRIGKSAGRGLALDTDGCCVFSFKKFVVVVEVPEDNSTMCLFYTKVCHLGPGDNREQVQKVEDSFNNLSTKNQLGGSDKACPCYFSVPNGTCGTKLSTKGDEVNLCFSVSIQGLSFHDMASHLERFMKTALAVNHKLTQAKCMKLSLAEPGRSQGSPHSPSSPSSSMRRLRLWSMDDSVTSDSSERSFFASLFTSSSSLGTRRTKGSLL